MAHIVADVNKLCSIDWYSWLSFCWQDCSVWSRILALFQPWWCQNSCCYSVRHWQVPNLWVSQVRAGQHRNTISEGAVANTSAGRGNWKRLYELNLWMWQYGRGQPLHVTVAEAEQRRKERTRDARRRAEVAPGGACANGWWQCWWLKGTCCKWCCLTCYVTCYITIRRCYLTPRMLYNTDIHYIILHLTKHTMILI
jgi:hypothetical protein